jgi:two-component system sensor histidine kinase YesM
MGILMITNKMKKQSKRKKQVRIQVILLHTFIMVSLISVLLTSSLTIFLQYKSFRKEEIQNLKNTNNLTDIYISQQLTQMDTILLNTTGLSTLDTFNQYQNLTDNNSVEKSYLKTKLNSQLLNAIGFDVSIQQLSLYGYHFGGYGIGKYNGDIPEAAIASVIRQEAIAADGSVYIEPPYKNPLWGISSNVDHTQYFFSIERLNFDKYHQPYAITEVTKKYDDVFRIPVSANSSINSSTYIYTKDGRLLYPLNDNTSTLTYFNNIQEGDGDFVNTKTGQKEYVCFSNDNDYGLIVVSTFPYSSLALLFLHSIIGCIVMALLILVLCFILSWYSATRISHPISHIYHFLARTDASKFEELEMANTGVTEVDKLRDSLNERIRTNKRITETMITLKEKNLQAEMLALQAQMNPHFLYNSLSTIAEMAEEGLNEEAAMMCSDITSILRYISSNHEQTVSLEEELEQVDTYLRCMKSRYGDDLNYSIMVPDQLLEIKIPKLCIQLLIENAIKYATTNLPPWTIQVKGTIQEGHWSISVSDNGPGFNPKILDQLQIQIIQIQKTGLLPNLEINGMGLMNVYIRCYQSSPNLCVNCLQI